MFADEARHFLDGDEPSGVVDGDLRGEPAVGAQVAPPFAFDAPNPGDNLLPGDFGDRFVAGQEVIATLHKKIGVEGPDRYHLGNRSAEQRLPKLPVESN